MGQCICKMFITKGPSGRVEGRVGTFKKECRVELYLLFVNNDSRGIHGSSKYIVK